jgi:hypothetical protein
MDCRGSCLEVNCRGLLSHMFRDGLSRSVVTHV